MGNSNKKEREGSKLLWNIIWNLAMDYRNCYENLEYSKSQLVKAKDIYRYKSDSAYKER